MLRGSMVALVTPMQADGSLDWEALHKLVDWHLQEGTDAIVAVGTTGESATLDVKEHIAVIRAVVDQVNGRVPVIAGTGANSTSEAIELTQAAKDGGVDACLLVAPYYNKPTQEGLFLHHQKIAASVAIPQLLYNVPGRTAVDMLPETIVRLSHVDNIVGVKEATGDIARVGQILESAKEGFLLISGDDDTAVDFIAAGGVGEISVTANVAPKLVAQMCELAAQGKVEEARAINARLADVHTAMFLESNPIPVKWALAKMGLMPNGIRLPLTPLDAKYHSQVEQALRAANLL
ncbi:4-hydroxy-tetrahydrodipicolinate synthase [Saccharophagus degradans]|uniref:4-hydroxy-tetrahydrodipicolinate synthase n=1 Tax=Saccharophagus degradans TaxID=86304 RepID=A0AAW7XAD7_9GAMM|nr:4-hydroxy-tetrahydrodipicolinate synthase [Saccharophagus degradans]MBU2987653.1 4-hydroxy-tetrahydrodipicolinate synthase [Saccharophagus degradans]MDO6424622.1 4-hydroxy-tetrahydrodipicolinate synthase [Saccharophagus degradans]MDO6608955.1 4-hydroxy-tetrahydrodipicolinate synthase [Saccharophagus degradans]WGO99913.1 4-hydroxy-tetrahydrodipicolinate synthase [Saccharophagus degradans]